MESPLSSNTWSEAFMLSDDSGLLLTHGSASSGGSSMNGDSNKGGYKGVYLGTVFNLEMTFMFYFFCRTAIAGLYRKTHWMKCQI